MNRRRRNKGRTRASLSVILHRYDSLWKTNGRYSTNNDHGIES